MMAFSPSPFFTPQQQQPQPFFQHPQQQQQQQQQQHPQIHVYTNDKAPVSYHTKWVDIHPDSRHLLLQIEEKILEHRDESVRLDQCQRLYDTSALNEGFELDAARISQELGGISTVLDREKVSLKELMKVAKEMLRNSEIAVRSYMMLRPRFPQSIPAITANAAPAASTSASVSNQLAAPVSQMASLSMPVIDFYSGIPTKPSPFMQQTITRFECQLQEYKQWIEELERLLVLEGEKENGTKNSEVSLLQSLPTVMMNVHDFFIYVAAEVENLHQQVGSMRAAYLADQQRRGHDNNPFLEADRREVAKQEAAARRVHPTLHVVPSVNPSTQSAQLLISSAAPSSTLFGTSPAGQSTVPAQLSSSQSLFGTSLSFTPAASSSTASPLFGSSTTPISSSGGLFGVASPASGGLFSSSPSPSGGLFGAGQTAASPFSASTQPFGSSNIANTGTSIFGVGAPQTTAPTKPKPRTTRRK